MVSNSGIQSLPRLIVPKDTVRVNISSVKDSTGNNITGIIALSKHYDMDYDEFLKLNHIDQDQKWTYKAKSNEEFYVLVDKKENNENSKISKSNAGKITLTGVGLATPTTVKIAKTLGKGKNVNLKRLFTPKHGKATLVAGLVGLGLGWLVDKFSHSGKTNETVPAPQTTPQVNPTSTVDDSNSKQITDATYRQIKDGKGNVKYTTRYVPGDVITVKANEQYKIYGYSSKPVVPVDKSGNVIAEVIKFEPTNPNGRLKGKTIMVNAGHGWGGSSASDAVFDRGTAGVDSNNKQLEEWYKNRNIANDFIEKLRAEGATVIYTAGKAPQACAAERKYKHDLFISLHHDYAADNKGRTNRKTHGYKIFYHKGDSTSSRFASVMEKSLDSLVSNPKEDNCKAENDVDGSQHQSLGVLTNAQKNKVPGILIECGFMSNDRDLSNIDSSKFRGQLSDKFIDGICNFLK